MLLLSSLWTRASMDSVLKSSMPAIFRRLIFEFDGGKPSMIHISIRCEHYSLFLKLTFNLN